MQTSLRAAFLLWLGGNQRLFFVCEAKTFEKPGYSRMMHRDVGRMGQRIAQLKKRDIRVLGHQFLKETNMRSKLPSSRWPTHRRNNGLTQATDLARPSTTRRGRNLQAACRLSSVQSFTDQSSKTVPECESRKQNDHRNGLMI